MMDPKYLIYHDLIGIQAYAKLKSKRNIGKFLDIGTVIDETRDILITEKENMYLDLKLQISRTMKKSIV